MTRLMPTDGPQLGVVVPLFDEAETVGETYRRLVAVLGELPLSFEILFVNDGSRDRTGEFLDFFAERDARVRVLHLSRNFGHQAAVSAGLEHVRGDAIVVMDGDLQDPPEVIPEFLERWREGFDVAYAIRTKRKEGRLKRAGYFLFYRLLRSIADLEIPLDSGDFCLMDRRVVDALTALPERERFVRGLRTFVGFRQIGVTYERAARKMGLSKYTLPRLVGLALDGIVNFSSLPLKAIAVVGFVVVLLGLMLAVGMLGHALVQGEVPSGWLIVLASLIVVGGAQLLGLGLVGEYVRRIYVEVKHRPTYIVSDVRPMKDDMPITRVKRAG